MLTETTYALLEQQLTTAFARATDRSLHEYLCDGTLQLGPRALRAYLRQDNLQEFLAAPAPRTWMTLAPAAQQIIASL